MTQDIDETADIDTAPDVDTAPGVDQVQETYELLVNGRSRRVDDAWIGESLLYVLRERLGLPGAKNACEQGECGSCSLYLDGVLVNSCCVLAADAVDGEIRTVEGLTGGDGGLDGAGAEVALTDVQAAFLDAGAVQCGFCIPGLIVTVHDLLDRVPDPSEVQVREAISGNLCRCTGYGRILQAVDDVRTARLAAGATSPPADATVEGGGA